MPPNLVQTTPFGPVRKIPASLDEYRHKLTCLFGKPDRTTLQLSAAGEGGCVLPGTIGATECVCTPVPLSMCGGNPPPAVPGKKQWLMIGDSISYGCLGPATDQAAAVNIQVTHNPTNAANVWWGSHCLETWLGPDPSRWDAVSFNFGLHDLALDNERIEPANYTRELANITSRIASALPKVKLLWVTTTPVPLGIDGGQSVQPAFCAHDAARILTRVWVRTACNKTTGQGGCPPRRATDPPVFNSAAARAIQASGHADRVTVLDLYSTVTKRCGTNYELCPENCTASHVNGKWEGNCFQIPHNVHYLPAAWEVLATAYVTAVKALIG